MDQALKSLAQRLRQRIPVGWTEAFALLRAHDGDLDLARESWKQEQAAELAKSEGIEAEDAARYLRFAQFDLQAARLSIRKTKFPFFPDRTLRYAPSPAQGLFTLTQHLGEHHQFPDNNLFQIWERREELPAPDFRLLLLFEWWEYLEKLGTHRALVLPEITLEFIRLVHLELKMEELVHRLQHTRMKLLTVLGGQPNPKEDFTFPGYMYPDLVADLNEIAPQRESFNATLFAWAWERKEVFPG